MESKAKAIGKRADTIEYLTWIAELKKRYRATQIKAAVAVNSALIEFYWNLGRDIGEKYARKGAYGADFFNRLSCDLKLSIPESRGFSTQNLRYCLNFYECYRGIPNFQQLVGELFRVPWGHHVAILDKCKGDCGKALFYVRRTIQNGWSRNVLLNWLATDLPADLGQLSGYLVMAEQSLNTPEDNPPIGVLICREHNRVLAKFHLERLGLPMGITDYEIKKILPTQAQLAKCYEDAEVQVARRRMHDV